MPRLSLYRPNKTNDYRFFDRTISEQFQVGGLDVYLHKYKGVATGNNSGDATIPSYDEENPLFIEDLLLLENRNRKYEEDVYTMRGIYNVENIDFDLSQFGIFLQNDTLFMNFHYNDMIDYVGRKLMNGDVFEFPNLKDYHPLDPANPIAIPKFYVVNDAAYSSEGFSPTWLPHLWRVKLTPLVGSQEYADILDKYADNTGGIDGDDGTGNGLGTLADYMCQHNKNLDVNDAILTQAQVEVPLSGYDVSKFYILNHDENGEPIDGNGITMDNTFITSDGDLISADKSAVTPESNGYASGYLTGDGTAPNGFPVTPATSFPPVPEDGEYVLRLDYSPNRLFRFNGVTWIKVDDNLRTDLYLNGNTQRSGFVNNNTVLSTNRGNVNSKQGLSDLLKPGADN